MVKHMLGLSPELTTHAGGYLTWSQFSAVTYTVLNTANIVGQALGRMKLSNLDKSLILGSVVCGIDGLISPFFNDGEPLHKKIIVNDPKNLVLTAEYLFAFAGQTYYMFRNLRR